MDFSGYTDNQIKKFREEGVPFTCKGVKFDFPADINYTQALSMAKDDVKEMYLANQQEELAEREEMLANGDIMDYSEYIGDYIEEYDPARFEQHIKETANKYMSNLYDISNSIVVHIPFDIACGMDFYDGTIKGAIEDKYGIPVISQGNVDVSKSTEVLSQKASDAVKATIEGADYQKFLDIKDNFERYSCNNIGLVYAQAPDAEAVKGYKAWKALDRQVSKGESAIHIFAPVFTILSNEDSVNKYVERNHLTDDEKDKLLDQIAHKGEVQVLSGFVDTPVFDIKQTFALNEKGEEIEHLLKLNKPLKDNAENFNEISTAMNQINFNTNEGGYIVSYPFVVPDDKNISEQERLYQAVHGYADKLFSENPAIITGIKSRIPSDSDMHKLEVAMSAYMVCKHIGIECEEKLALEISHTMNNIQTDAFRIGKNTIFETAFSRADAFSKEFNKEFDKFFEKEEMGKDKQNTSKPKKKMSDIDR